MKVEQDQLLVLFLSPGDMVVPSGFGNVSLWDNPGDERRRKVCGDFMRSNVGLVICIFTGTNPMVPHQDGTWAMLVCVGCTGWCRTWRLKKA